MSNYGFYVSPWMVVCYGNYISSGERFDLSTLSRDIKTEEAKSRTLVGLILDQRGLAVAIDFSFKKAIAVAGIANMGSIDGTNNVTSVALFSVESPHIGRRGGPILQNKQDLLNAYYEGHRGMDAPDFLKPRERGMLF